MSEDLYSAGVSTPRALSSSPSLHGGRGASPSEGGRPSDLSALAGGGRDSEFHLCAVPLGDAPGRVFSTLRSKEGEDEISSEYVDHQEGGDCGFHAAASGSSPPAAGGTASAIVAFLVGAKLPLYAFGVKRNLGSKRAHQSIDDRCVPEAVGDFIDYGVDDSPQQNYFLDELLLAQWEDRMIRGLFRYDVTACETKMLAGEYGFIAQLNEGRHMKKRPTEFRVDQVLQPFDPKKFNFTKVGQEEVLFQFGPSEDDVSEYYEKAPVLSSPNVVAINVSPIEYGHVLLVPRVLDCLPQRIDQDSLLLALYMAAEANNPYFRLGYNSLGAFATINHLHFQAYYLAAPFPIERAPTARVAYGRKKGGVKVYELEKYPVRGLVFEMCNSIEDLSVAVANACVHLQNENIPYNVLISERGSRVFVLPQCFAERQARGEVEQEILDIQVNPAVWEISGHIVLKQRKDYEMATEEYAWRLLAEVTLSKERFEEVKAACLKAAFEGSCGDGAAEATALAGHGGRFNVLVKEQAVLTKSNIHKANSSVGVVPNTEEVGV